MTENASMEECVYELACQGSALSTAVGESQMQDLLIESNILHHSVENTSDKRFPCTDNHHNNIMTTCMTMLLKTMQPLYINNNL